MKYVIVTAAAAALAGCATIFSGSTQSVTIQSVPDAAAISITNRNGEAVHSGTTPATVVLKRGAGFFKPEQYTVEISKPGFQTRKVAISGTVNGWYVGNLLFGGLIGLLIVDPATGAMYRLSPDAVTATLDASRVRIEPGARAFTVMLAQDLPAQQWPYAQELGAH